MEFIPFNKPYFPDGTIDYIARSLNSGKVCGDGPFTWKTCEKIIKQFNAKHVFLTPSCTHSLELAMRVIDIKPGDEVICPSFTFVSTANAIIMQQGRPVFAEIEELTLNLDPESLEKVITPNTRAVIPVHYAGVSSEMDTILRIAADHNLYVIEDAAQGVDASYKGKYLGTIGHMGAYSFHETKNINCGEGGALLVDSDEMALRAEILREKGTNRSAFLRGEVDKYTWIDQGSSYLLSDILAAILDLELDRLTEVKEYRQKVFNAYFAGLLSLEKEGKLQLPYIPEHCSSNYHIFYILLPDNETRNRLMDGLKARNVGVTFHYVPLHSSPYAIKHLGYSKNDFPVTESVSERLLRLPIYPGLTEAEVGYIVDNIFDLLK